MKCLIVDDEAFCRDFVATLLSATADCHQATSGMEALEKYNAALASDEPFDLVIMDIMMPGMSGHDAAKAIRHIEKEQKPAKRVNIVMLTALNSSNDAMESFCNAQSAAYLVKPVSKEGLFNVLSKLGLMKR
ncbi:response regulator [Geomonas paludis]|uniref:Response regulator n=2 Tax=Geomonas TaxID=2651583 RepID=A0A6V8MUY4_9BACT|nr:MULTISPECIES: response regulator [Geomonas]MBJ6750149.1 response regulator [Geomonas anaerohicana]UPU38098.1 response regulator [Geomonas paludis]GFO63373.1 response regulator [Geomonas paludis]